MKTLQEVHEYLNDVGFFYLSTVDREKPKCRPMGVHMLIDVVIGGDISGFFYMFTHGHYYRRTSL